MNAIKPAKLKEHPVAISNTTKKIAMYAILARARALFLLPIACLAACALPDKPVRPQTYDFGPGAISAAAPANLAALPTLMLAEVDTSPALDGNALLYRLAYADPQVLRPYAQARWSMPPAQLVRQRLSSQLGARRAVLGPGDAALATPPGAAPVWVLRTELEEFSQLFDSPASSSALVRLRATVTQASPLGDRLLGQRSFVVQRPAPAQDAAGGVRALAAATDAAVADIEQWLLQLR